MGPKLKWRVDGTGDLRATHPHFDNDGTDLEYFVCDGGDGKWTALFEGSTLVEGDLIECLQRCQEDSKRVRS